MLYDVTIYCAAGIKYILIPYRDLLSVQLLIVLSREEYMNSHESMVEYFYSHGPSIISDRYDTILQQTKEFLSFGYWEKGTKTYLQAAKNLLTFFIQNSKIEKATKILNVACGYGAETFVYYDIFKPELIEGVDITRKHVEYSNKKAHDLHLDKWIKFHHGDACAMEYPENSFSNIFAIEGPAHFRTREEFFSIASKILQKDGELLMTDIILGEKYNTAGSIKKRILSSCVKNWVIPEENIVNEDTYKMQMERAGLKLVFFHKVFPGYALNALSLKTFFIRLSQRGWWTTWGLSFISFLLGVLYKTGMIEYIYVKGRK